MSKAWPSQSVSHWSLSSKVCWHQTQLSANGSVFWLDTLWTHYNAQKASFECSTSTAPFNPGPPQQHRQIHIWMTKTYSRGGVTLRARTIRTAAHIFESMRRWGFMRIHNHCFMPSSSPPPVAAAGCVATVGAGLALPRHLLQEVGQAGAAALPMLVAAQGLHTAEGLRLGGR